MTRRLLAGACVFWLAACGADQEFRKAGYLESARRHPEAARAFQGFARRYPADPRAAEALVRAGRIHARVFGRCREARPLYEQAARHFGSLGPWPGLARRGLLDCPNYFPLQDGARRVYVDSQTGGRNMTLDFRVAASGDGERGEAVGAYYAGKTRFQGYRRRYEKADWAIWESEGMDRVRLLRYPFQVGMSWRESRNGRATEFLVESDAERVEVLAGRFFPCLKVRERLEGAAAWKYEYYAPGVGRVKTTVGGPGFEHSNTELKSYSPPIAPTLGPAQE